MRAASCAILLFSLSACAPAQPLPLDVYTPEGDLLFSGLVALDSWEAAWADYIYRIETDPSTGEEVVARYRIVEPF